MDEKLPTYGLRVHKIPSGKTSEIIDDTNHEFFQVVGFQVEALIAFHSMGCGMSFEKE